MSTPLRVLITTDSFPPACGGSGWSTWELVRGLAARGHHVDVIRVKAGDSSAITEEQHEGQRVTTFQINAPSVPFVRNLVKNEQLWHRLARYLDDVVRRERPDIIHAQHVMTTVPSIRAARSAAIPVVATVRDYWPVCYWSDLIYDPSQPGLCPACSAGMMTTCIKPRAGSAHLAAWPLIPYMRSNLATKRRVLSQADAVIAVSSTIAKDLSTRAPELNQTTVYTIPNPIDMSALDAARLASESPHPGPYLLYVGKLATNKGVQYLLPAIERASIDWPIVAIGDGPLRRSLEADARARGMSLQVLGWRERHEVWAWMRHTTLLAFPSYGPESLSRVLIEAAALGVPIAAMNTGGTRDILTPRETGLLSTTPDEFARDLRELATDERLRAHLGAAARADVHTRFSAVSVVERVEHVYRSLLMPQAA